MPKTHAPLPDTPTHPPARNSTHSTQTEPRPPIEPHPMAKHQGHPTDSDSDDEGFVYRPKKKTAAADPTREKAPPPKKDDDDDDAPAGPTVAPRRSSVLKACGMASVVAGMAWFAGGLSNQCAAGAVMLWGVAPRLLMSHESHPPWPGVALFGMTSWTFAVPVIDAIYTAKRGRGASQLISAATSVTRHTIKKGCKYDTMPFLEPAEAATLAGLSERFPWNMTADANERPMWSSAIVSEGKVVNENLWAALGPGMKIMHERVVVPRSQKRAGSVSLSYLSIRKYAATWDAGRRYSACGRDASTASASVRLTAAEPAAGGQQLCLSVEEAKRHIKSQPKDIFSEPEPISADEHSMRMSEAVEEEPGFVCDAAVGEVMVFDSALAHCITPVTEGTSYFLVASFGSPGVAEPAAKRKQQQADDMSWALGGGRREW